MQYSRETIAKLVKVAEEKGEYGAVAGYLDIHPTTLGVHRKECPILDKALSDAIRRYYANNRLPEDYNFSLEELAEITKIVSEQNVDAAARIYGSRADKFFRMRKSNPQLEAAIVKGQKLREVNTPSNEAIKLFKDFGVRKLKEVTEVTKNSGIEALENKYGFSSHVLNKTRKELPKLDAAIKAGFRKRPIGAAIPSIKAKIAESKNEKKERKISKPYKTKDKTRKPPKEIINKTMIGIEDQTETALLKFKKRMEENKKKEFVKRMRSGDFDDMIGF